MYNEYIIKASNAINMTDFKLRIRVYTTHNEKYLKGYKEEITTYFQQAKHLKVEDFDIVEIEPPKDVKVVYKHGEDRIDRGWFEENFSDKAEADGYNMVCFAFSAKERARWGISDKIAGSYFRDSGDNIFEFWVAANPRKKDKDYDMDKWVRIFIHEASHGFNHLLQTKAVDNTHVWDYQLKAIHKIFPTYNFAEAGNLQKQISLLKQIKMLYRTLLAKQDETLIFPLEASLFHGKVSQAFGVPNKIYKSGIHNGTDWAVPRNTRIVAPTEVEIIAVYDDHSSMGNAFVARFKHKGEWYLMRCLHLSMKPQKGWYKQGEVIGYTGNTGRVYGKRGGYHLHMEIWQAFNIDIEVLYNKESVLKTLHDPVQFFVGRVAPEYRRDEKIT